MSYCASDIVLLAGQIYTGIGAPSAQSPGYISGWLTQPANLGGLNNRLNTSFYLSGSSPCILGDFGDAEANIYSLVYQSDYYRQRSLAVLAGGDSGPWLSLAEGDSKVSRESTASRSAAYLNLAKDADKTLWIAVANWKIGQSLCATVDGTDLPAYPSP